MRVLFLLHDWVIDPLGVGYLSSALKAAGHTVGIKKTAKMYTSDYQLAYTFKQWDIDYMPTEYREISDFHPDVLAYSVTTGWHQYYMQLNRELKNWFPDTISVFGGPHPTFFPEMVEEEGVDVIVQGEAEETMVALMARLETEWDRIKGSGKYIAHPQRLNQDLDSIAFPDRDLLYSYPENRDNGIRNIMLSRGCPFSCSYCYNGSYKKMYPGQQTLRYRSVHNVIEEAVLLKKDYPNTRLIFFQDDEFIVNAAKLVQFAHYYKEAVGLPFHCQLRAEAMTTDKVRMLKDAGCVSVTFAVETGNARIRETMLKRKMTNEHITNCCVMLQNAGIAYRIENMIGLPGETIDEALETLDLNIECKPDVAFCSLFQPYPKTPLGDLCQEMCIWDGDPDGISKSFFDESTIKRDTAREFNNLQKLFGIVVEFPILRPFIRLLIKMPRTRLLAWVSTKFRRWAYDRRLYHG